MFDNVFTPEFSANFSLSNSFTQRLLGEIYCATSIRWHFCLERARHTLDQSFSFPFQGGKIIGAPSPRALPWAKMRCPCRAEDANNPRNQNVNLLALKEIGGVSVQEKIEMLKQLPMSPHPTPLKIHTPPRKITSSRSLFLAPE